MVMEEHPASPINRIMHDTTPCALLLLPAELRLQIYNYVIPKVPLSQPRTQYSGLVFSCKQTRAEMEPTILKIMHDVLAGIAKTCLEVWQDDITFATSHTLFELENLTVLGGFKWRRTPESYNQRRWDHPILKLLKMHFHALTIKAACKHDDTDSRPHGVYFHWIAFPFKDPLRKDAKRGTAVKSFEFDCSATRTCPYARRRSLSARIIKDINSAGIWEVRVREDEDRNTINVRFGRLPVVSTLNAVPEGCTDNNDVTCG
jgi:hypothetical protein